MVTWTYKQITDTYICFSIAFKFDDDNKDNGSDDELKQKEVQKIYKLL